METLIKFFAIVCVVCLTACNELLNNQPVSSISVNSFWENEDDAKGVLFGMYDLLRGMNRDLYIMGEARSEMMDDETAGRNPDWRIKYFRNTLSAANADLGWQDAYKIIGNANLIIENVSEINFSDNDVERQILAEALTMRAFIYFVLAKTWGDVPLITEPISDISPNVTFKSRAPVTDVFALIDEDLDKAISEYPDFEFSNCRCRWSKSAAFILKAESMLWQIKVLKNNEIDLSHALTNLEEAEKANVSLLEEYDKIFAINNKANEEIIMAIYFNSVEAVDNHYVEMYPLGGNISLGDELTQQELNPGGDMWWAPSSEVIEQFSEDDLRKESSIHTIYRADNGEKVVSGVVKFKGEIEGGIRKFNNDIILYRYADMLLLKAEIKNYLNIDPSEEMNIIRKRVYGEEFSNHIFENSDKESNDNEILKERLFELGWEGKRWWDLVRFNKAYELVPSLNGKENEIPLLFPLDEETLTRNSSLVQTVGY